MLTILRIGAWLSLVGGVATGLFTLFTVGQFGSAAILFGVAYLFSGFLMWALLLVIAGIKEQLERMEYGVVQVMQRTEPERKPAKSYSVLDGN